MYVTYLLFLLKGNNYEYRMNYVRKKRHEKNLKQSIHFIFYFFCNT